MNCNEVRENLSAYLDQELSVAERKLIDNHLLDCLSCRQELAALGEITGMLSSMEELIPPAGFRRGLYEKLARDINKETKPVPKESSLRGIIYKFFGKTRRSVVVPVAITLFLILLIGPSVFSNLFDQPIMGNRADLELMDDDSISSSPSSSGSGSGSMKSMSMQYGDEAPGDYAREELNRERMNKAEAGETDLTDTAPPDMLMIAENQAENQNEENTEQGTMSAAPEQTQVPTKTVQQSVDLDKKIIKNAQLNLLVDNYDLAVTALKEKASIMGGYTQNESLYATDTEERKSGQIEVRIPQQFFDDYLTEAYTFGKVKQSNTYAQNVTEEYVDVESRLKAMRTKEERLLAILTQQGNLSDILAVENELANTRSQLEALQGRLRYLENKTGYSTINITLEQIVLSTQEVTLGGFTGVGARAKEAFIEAVNNVLLGTCKFIIFLSSALPYMVVAVIITLAIRFGLKKRKEFYGNGD